MINDDAQGWTSSDTIAQNERVICELSAEVASLRAKLETVWTEESLANAIKSRQVILCNVDGGTNIGTLTSADAAMLARIALARYPMPVPITPTCPDCLALAKVLQDFAMRLGDGGLISSPSTRLFAHLQNFIKEREK